MPEAITILGERLAVLDLGFLAVFGGALTGMVWWLFVDSVPADSAAELAADWLARAILPFAFFLPFAIVMLKVPKIFEPWAIGAVVAAAAALGLGFWSGKRRGLSAESNPGAGRRQQALPRATGRSVAFISILFLGTALPLLPLAYLERGAGVMAASLATCFLTALVYVGYAYDRRRKCPNCAGLMMFSKTESDAVYTPHYACARCGIDWVGPSRKEESSDG